MTAFCIGTNRNTGRSIMLRLEELCAHAIVAGRTGQGKTQLANLLARFCVRNGIAATYLVPHGDGYEDIVAYATTLRLQDRLITIDANEAADRMVFPLNFLQPNGLDSATHAAMVMKALAKVFREQDAETKPRLERRERATLISLIEAGYTLAEMLDFLSIDDGRFRAHVLTRVKNAYVRAEWQEFDSIARRSDKENLIESTLNRACKVILNDPIRRVIGSATCNLDWEEIRRKRQIVLVNLQPVKVAREAQLLIGTMLLDHLTNYAMQQTKRENPLLVLADEMDELASPDFALMFQALRKRRVFCWSFFQYLEQLRSRDDTNRLFASAMTNCDIKIAFKSSYEDSAILVRELFPGAFRGDLVKDELYRTMLLPRESRRQIVGSSESESETMSESESFAEFDGTGIGNMSVDGIASAEGQTFGGTYGDVLQSSELSSMSSISGASSSSMSGSTRSTSSTRSQSRGRSRSQAEVPFYEYERMQELAGRQYFSVEEELEKCIYAIQRQERREAFLKVGNAPAVPILTAFVKPVRVRPQDIRHTLEKIARRYSQPVEVVDAAIAERRRLALSESTADSGVDNGQVIAGLFKTQRRKR